MTKRALLGLYTILSLLALVGLFAILSDFQTKLRGYRIGVRFPTAAGLHAGGLVYESGVVVGSVDDVHVLSDYSTEVVLALKSDIDVPRNAHFVILQPLSGDANLRISVAEQYGGHSSAPLPHEVLPIAQQPIGIATVSLAEFLANSQQQFQRFDALLSDFQTHGPVIFDNLEHTLINANSLMVNANRSIVELSKDAHTSLSQVSESSTQLTAQLSQSLALASADVLQATARLNESSKRGQPHLDHIFVELDHASRSLANSVESLHAIAADPAIHDNVVKSTKSLADTAATFAALLGDLRQVTGSETTQAELRDAVAHIDAATQKADSFMSQFGHSHVPGVDVPLNVASPVPGGPVSAVGGQPQTATSAAPAGTAGTAPAILKTALHPVDAPRRLISIDLREGELSPLHRSATGTPLNSPLLSQDRGPQTDLGLTVFPDARTSFLLGGNDIGGTSTLTAAELQHHGALTYGGGLLYSRLGVLGAIKAGPIGLESRIYDPRRGSVDLYGNLFTGAHTTIFAGERDATRASRRAVYGLDFHF